MFRFEKLDVWKKAIDLADKVYRLTREFPDYERFGLANQMRRAEVSISSNVAESSSRSSSKDVVRFIEIARMLSGLKANVKESNSLSVNHQLCW